jgi:hypothetical protein
MRQPVRIRSRLSEFIVRHHVLKIRDRKVAPNDRVISGFVDVKRKDCESSASLYQRWERDAIDSHGLIQLLAHDRREVQKKPFKHEFYSL